MPIPERVFVPVAKDPGRKHFYISLIKSGLRIAGCIAVLLGASIMWLPGLFLAAELLGILDEL